MTATTTWDKLPVLWPQLLGEVHAIVRWAGSTGRPGRNVLLYRDDQPRVEVGVELDQPAHFDGRLTRSHLPAGTVATVVHHGPPAGLFAAHEEIRDFCWGQRLRLAGPRWEVYGHPPGDGSHPVIEIFYLVA